MAVALFMVAATIPPEHEDSFNEWYNHEHIPDTFKFNGMVSARRYKTILTDEKFQYITVYELESEETLRRFLESDHLKWLRERFDAQYGGICERQRHAYVQVWP